MLIACGVAALMTIFAAFYFKGVEEVESWLTLAAALAVLASLFATWSAQISIEFQQDQMRPEVVIYLEVGVERYQLVSIRMKNVGKSSSFRISDHWNDTISNHRGNPISFGGKSGFVSVLHPDQTISKAVDVQHVFAQKYRDKVFDGVVKFEDVHGRCYHTKFVIDTSQYEGMLSYDQEQVRTHFELQKIPGKLDEIKMELKRMIALRHKDDEEGPPHSRRADPR